MLATLCLVASFVVSPQDDFAALTTGVTKLPKPGVPGVVSAISKSSVSFVTGQDGKSLLPVASAGRLGKGKVVGFGHGAFLNMAALNEGDTSKLLSNVLNWLSARSSARVGYLQAEDRQWIERLGFQSYELRRNTLATDLRNVDVAVVPGNAGSRGLIEFVRSGGGVLTSHTPWGWMQLNPGKDLASQMPMQDLLHEAGLSFSDGAVDSVRPTSSFEESQRLNAEEALDRQGSDGLQASITIMAALRSTTEEQPFHRKVRQAVRSANPALPSEVKPVRATDVMSRLAITVGHLDREAGKSAPKSDPSANDFPGSVPDSAPRVDGVVNVRLSERGWISTGYYAAPGETITVEAPGVFAGVNVQIGCHSDQLWHLDQWKRHPEITVRAPLAPPVTRLSSPFGGLVYITVDRAHQTPDLKLRIANVIRSARYVHGQTTLAQWKEQLKHPAPWAEIGSEKLIFSVPLADAKKVEDPVALMNLWDRSMDLISELDGRPLLKRPERIVCDRQISAGYMHSGYPIMTWMDKSIELSLSLSQLTNQGTWGHWHELGHNRQKPEWTFSGTGEVTNNLYTLYLMNKVAGQSIWERVSGERAKVRSYLAKGGDFEEWKREPFLALTMYVHLIDAFGWDALKAYFRSYEDPANGPLPRNDQEKRDQFLTRYSKIVKRDLSAYFQKWGVPTSQSARESLRQFQTWMPPGLP